MVEYTAYQKYRLSFFMLLCHIKSVSRAARMAARGRVAIQRGGAKRHAADLGAAQRRNEPSQVAERWAIHKA